MQQHLATRVMLLTDPARTPNLQLEMQNIRYTVVTGGLNETIRVEQVGICRENTKISRRTTEVKHWL